MVRIKLILNIKTVNKKSNVHMFIVCLFTVGVQHGADHHLHGVRHQDEKST